MESNLNWERTIAGNYVLNACNFFISFNPKCSDSRGSETALINDSKDLYEYHILDGDWRKEYEKFFPLGFDACKQFYMKNLEFRSEHSTDDIQTIDVQVIEENGVIK